MMQITSRISTSDPRLLKGARRNKGATVGAPMTEKVVDLWKEWVKRRWNPDAKFLNLEVSSPKPAVACSQRAG